MISTVLMVLVVFAAMYFLMIRPANKRMKEQQDTISAIQPGSRVMLASGMFATVRHVGDKQMVVELAPDCVVTVLKGAVTKVVAPDEEEFEYDDAADAASYAGAALGANATLAAGAQPVEGEIVESTTSPYTGAEGFGATPVTRPVRDDAETQAVRTQDEPTENYTGPEFIDPRDEERR